MRQTCLLLLLAALLSAGCATIGREFPTAPVADIEIGETTREEIRHRFGEPWRTGLEDGYPTWTYAYYHYALFGKERTRDLVVRFDKDGVVNSYTFNTSNHESGGE